MFLKTIFVILAFASCTTPVTATTIIDTGQGFAYTARPAGDGVGQGVSVTTDTTLSAFGFDFFLPDGGSALFMIWDDMNTTLLFTEEAHFNPQSEAAFRFTSTLNAFSLSPGHSYYFGIIANAEIDLGYFFPPPEIMQHGLSLWTDGNANYSNFAAPFAADTGGASLALQLVGDQAAQTDTPEVSTWVTLMSGLALLVAGRRFRRKP